MTLRLPCFCGLIPKRTEGIIPMMTSNSPASQRATPRRSLPPIPLSKDCLIPCPSGHTPCDHQEYDLLAILSALLPGHGISLQLHRDPDFPHPALIAKVGHGKPHKLSSVIFQARTSHNFPAPPWGEPRSAHWRRQTPVSKPPLRKLIGPPLAFYECSDLFTHPSGGKIAADHKSITYRRPNNTSETDEVVQPHKAIPGHLEKIPVVVFR